jgi:division protein CdvB (Snf7/Vps24/ESCRT-III family)
MEAEVRREFDEIRAILRAVAERQAASEARMDRAEARMDKAEARMDRFDARARESDARFEKRMKGFETLARIGMKEIVELRRLHRESEHKLNALIDSHQRTEAALRAFMDSLRRGGNGHGGRTR